jgi:hypothetical protein
LVNDTIYQYAKKIYLLNHNTNHINLPAIFGVNANEIEQIYRDNTMYKNIYRPTIKNETNDAYMSMIDYTANDVYKMNVYPMSDELKEYMDKYKYLLDLDNEYETKRVFNLLIRPNMMMYRYNRDSYYNNHVHTSDIYCPDGHRHDYSTFKAIYVYHSNTKGDNKKYEYTFKEVLKLDSRKDIKLVGEKCSRCHRLLNATPINIDKELKLHTEIDNLFKHFENLCPVTDNIHEFKTDKDGFIGNHECVKCDFRKSYLVEKPKSYFNKWHSKIKSTAFNILDITPVSKEYKYQKFENWKTTLASLLQIAKVSNISYNIWLNIGLTEHENFNAIKLSRINPSNSVNELQSATRSTKIIGHIRFIIINYNLMKNNAKIIVSSVLRNILEDDPPKLNLYESMPPLLDNFDAMLAYYSKQLTKIELCNWLLNLMASILLQIKNLDSKLGKFAKRFFQYLVDEIIRSEFLVSEIEIQKMVIIQTSDDGENYGVEQSNLTLEDEEIAEDDITDPFSLEDIDIITSNTGNDDEDFMD